MDKTIFVLQVKEIDRISPTLLLLCTVAEFRRQVARLSSASQEFCIRVDAIKRLPIQCSRILWLNNKLKE